VTFVFPHLLKVLISFLNLCLLHSDVPGAPINLHTTDVSKSKISIAWEPPKTDGGTKIKGYVVERRQARSTRWTRLNKTLIDDLEFTMTDVAEGQDYEFQVTAENAEGLGAPSDTLGPIKAKDPYGEYHECRSLNLIHSIVTLEIELVVIETEVFYCDL
jgi:hypothetical protein